jgi:putative iron-dependent peroxidase
VPSADLLEALADRAAPADAAAAQPAPSSLEPRRDGSLNIGSLKGAKAYE